MLIKISLLTDDGALGGGVVELPALVALQIANKHALLHVWGQSSPLILLHMDVCSAAPHSEVRDIWLALVPKFKGCSIEEDRVGGAVEDMDKGSECLAPELTRETRLCQHCGDPLVENAVCALRDTVLLRVEC